MTKIEILQIITGFLASCGFAILFHIRGKRFFVTVLGSIFSWAIFLVLGFWITGEILRYFIVAMIMSFYAEVMARWIKTPTTTFITVSLVPLIPGASLYYTMAYAFDSDLQHFLQKGGYTLQLAAALALGILFATAATSLFNHLFYRKKYSFNSKI